LHDGVAPHAVVLGEIDTVQKRRSPSDLSHRGLPVSVPGSDANRHNRCINKNDYRQIRTARGKALTCQRKPDGTKGATTVGLEHDPEKWLPVFRKDHAPMKKLDHDPIQFDRITV
jgi:hypothetical protein